MAKLERVGTIATMNDSEVMVEITSKLDTTNELVKSYFHISYECDDVNICTIKITKEALEDCCTILNNPIREL